jgi:DNA-binding response OmpR family regulator
MRILLAEDDPPLGDGLWAALRQLGFLVDWVRDGVAAERELRMSSCSAAVLDVGLRSTTARKSWRRFAWRGPAFAEPASATRS